MMRMLDYFEVAPGRADEAERLLKEWASRMKGSPGFSGGYVFKEVEHTGGRDYAPMCDWENSEDLQAFW